MGGERVERRAIDIEAIEAICKEKHKSVDVEIASIKGWLSKIDNRIWLLVITAMLQFASVAGVLLMMVIKQ